VPLSFLELFIFHLAQLPPILFQQSPLIGERLQQLLLLSIAFANPIDSLFRSF
jgi:hypothetical protein